MNDDEFVRLLELNLTLTYEAKWNRGKPYLEISLVTIPGKDRESITLGKVIVDSQDLKIEE